MVVVQQQNDDQNNNIDISEIQTGRVRGQAAVVVDGSSGAGGSAGGQRRAAALGVRLPIDNTQTKWKDVPLDQADMPGPFHSRKCWSETACHSAWFRRYNIGLLSIL